MKRRKVESNHKLFKGKNIECTMEMKTGRNNYMDGESITNQG